MQKSAPVESVTQLLQLSRFLGIADFTCENRSGDQEKTGNSCASGRCHL
jgi:hypothetical protein